MSFADTYFIIGNAYAGKSTMCRLLAERHGGILCEENYHDRFFPEPDAAAFPCLAYTRNLKDWHDFIRRTPEEYEAWIDGAAAECERLELRILPEVEKQGGPLFVDTNISPETLRRIAKPRHVLVMLADPQISVRRFFDRPDREKQFLYRLIMEEPDPERAMENYRRGLERINSRERYERFLGAGFPVILREEGRNVEETLSLAEEAFGLGEEVRLVQAASEDVETIWRMQKEAFAGLLEKYRDYETNPGAEGPEKVKQRMARPGSVYYFIMRGKERAGVIRIVDRGDGSRRRISPLFIMPAFRRRGYAWAAMRLAEGIYGADRWTLGTILQEEGNCRLYEAAGYRRTGELRKVNDRMDLVFYEKG